ncbi:hypothetical protein BVC80_1307g16 [Macleaya cordata]|uniref:Uncharacterized protein n=1 Tax=Macleaya cordata TaxID=56857 RepID=A0A200R379_MACCD|nr:hypothetical protein BVC80_1307g16 [Macleaya cordata]
MINILGLCNLGSLKDIKINITSSAWGETKRLPIQGIHEHGIFNIFLPGNEIPSYMHKSKDSPISFILPILPNKIKGLNVATIYAFRKKLCDYIPLWHMIIQVNNNSKGLKWIYVPTFFGSLDVGKDMIWLSHWKSGNQLEGGDEVTVSIFVGSTDDIKFKECGIHVVYEQETTTDHSDVGGISEYWQDYYEVMPRTYLLMGGPSSYISREANWTYWEEYSERSKQLNRE